MTADIPAYSLTAFLFLQKKISLDDHGRSIRLFHRKNSILISSSFFLLFLVPAFVDDLDLGLLDCI
jgi:hypothetical protein